jgi:phage-related protein
MPATLALPDLSSLTDSRDGILGAVEQVVDVLPGDPAQLLSGLTDGTGSLEVALDVGSLTGGVTDALGGLTSALPSGSLPELQELLTAVSGALGSLEPLKQALTHNGDLLDLKSLALQQTGDPTARITEALGHLTNVIPADAIQTLETFIETLTGFESSMPTEVDQIAAFIGRGFLGVPADVLGPARGALDSFVGSVTALAPQAQVDAAHSAATALAAELGSARSLVIALDPADSAGYAAVIAALTQLRTHVQEFATQVGALATAFRSGLAGIDPGGFLSTLESALSAIPELDAPDPNAFVELVTDPIRRINELIDTVSPAQLAEIIRRGSEFAAHELLDAGLDEVDAILRKPFEDVGHLIEGLHIEKIREAFRDALAPVHDAITSVTGAIASIRDELVQAIDSAVEAVDVVTSAAGEVETALNELATTVQSAAVSIDLTAFHDEAVSLIEELAQAITGLVGEAGQAVAKLHELIGELGDIDLQEASSAATDAIGELTVTISSIDTSKIPDALLTGLKSALMGLLDQISLQPVHDAIAQVIDSAPLDVLDEFTQAYEGVLHELETFSPGSLLEPLEQPFDDIVRQLNDLRPGALLDPIVQGLQEAKTALDGLSPAALLAPLDAPLAEARSAIEQLAPSQLLEPLQEPFDELMALVDKLDGKAALEAIQGELSGWFEQGLGGLSELGDGFAGAGGTKAFLDAAHGGSLGDELGLRPGDILIPVQELYEKLVGLLDQVPIDSLVAAFEQVRESLVGTLDALAQGGLQRHVHDEIEAAVRVIDVTDDADLLVALLPAHTQLVLAVDGIDPAGAAPEYSQLVSLTFEADPRAALAPVLAELHGLRDDVVALVGSVETGVLGGFGDVFARLDALIPDFLREPVTADALHEALDALNPKHIAEAVNHEFDILLEKLVKYAEMLGEELPKLAAAWTGRIQHGLDGLIRDAFDAVHAPLKGQLETLSPSAIAADLDQEVFDPIRSTLDSLSLESIVSDSELGTKLDGAKTALDGVIGALQNVENAVGGAFDTAVNSILAVSPRSLEGDLQQAYAPVAQALGQLDLGGLADELMTQFQRIGGQAADVLQAVLEALKAMVAAIPRGVEGVSAEVSFGL